MTRRDRYGEPAADPVPAATVDHDPRCRNGYLGEDDNGHPIPCPGCKPWLVACPTCGTSTKRCEFDRGQMRGRCCPDCPHVPPVTKTRRKRIKTQEAGR
jgi:hypothetical protein